MPGTLIDSERLNTIYEERYQGDYMAEDCFTRWSHAGVELRRVQDTLKQVPSGAIGTVLTAGYMLWMIQKVNLGEPKDEWSGKEFHDVDRYEWAAWAPLLAGILVIGIFPKIVFGATDGTVEALIRSAFGG